MSNSLIIGIIVIILVGGAGYFYFLAPDEDTTDVPTTNTPTTNTTNETPSTNTGTSTGSQTATSTGSASGTSALGVTEVAYSDSGFSPKRIEIRQGETIRFVNNSTRPMWVGSDDHPTHTIYPEFDQKASVNAGGTYEFKFEKVGTWGYHNHRRAADTGTIVVE